MKVEIGYTKPTDVFFDGQLGLSEYVTSTHPPAAITHRSIMEYICMFMLLAAGVQAAGVQAADFRKQSSKLRSLWYSFWAKHFTVFIRIIDQAASNYAKEVIEWKAVEQGMEYTS